MTEPLILLSSMATRHILAELAEACRAETGVSFNVQAMGGVDAAQKVRAGAMADLVLLAHGAMEKLAAEGYVEGASLAPFVLSSMAVAVPAGARLPDLSSGETLKAAMMAARAVAYSTGPSGDHLKALWAAWGVADAIGSRAVLAPAGVPVARLVAEGQADLGVQQLSELLGQPGIAIAGPLPADVQSTTVFTGGIARTSTRAAVAHTVLAFLTAEA